MNKFSLIGGFSMRSNHNSEVAYFMEATLYNHKKTTRKLH